jgi:hypothetical protein
MNMRQQLIILIKTYASAKGLSTSRVATLVFNHGTMYERLIDGADITVGRLETAVRWFSTNWPESTPWPEGISRPPPQTPSSSHESEVAS